MVADRNIKKFKNRVNNKLDKWEFKSKFKINFDDVRNVVNQNCDVLEKEGLKFNINLPAYRKVLVEGLELLCLKMENNENPDSLNILFLLNSRNNENIELFELAEHGKIIDAEFYRSILELMYNKENRGQPHEDPVLIFKILYLQAKYGLSDEQVLIDIVDRDSFQFFLDYPEKLPCKSTLGNFRDRLTEHLLLDELWFKHQEQLNNYGYPTTRELATDADFLDTNQGSYGKPRGDKAKTRRSKDGTSMMKNNESHFGFKITVVIDIKYQLLRRYLVTTAAIHDSQITFDFLENYIMYADKGYLGADFKCFKAYMLRKSNIPKINARREHRNWRINRKKALVERVFAVFHEHKQDFTKLTTVKRNQVKIFFASLLYNVKQIITLGKKPHKKNNKKSPELDTTTLFKLIENTPEMVKHREQSAIMKKRRLKRIKNTKEKYISMFKKPKNKKRSKKSNQESQKPNKKFNRKLAYSF